MRPWRAAWISWAIAAALLSGCAQQPRATTPDAQPTALWTGRLALRIDSEQPQSFFAGFELKGNALTGELSLYSPLGSTIAQLAWSPGDARLSRDGQQSRFESLDALTRQATGTELPIASMFQWLAGENASAPGWQADLSEMASRRLVARRLAPPPAVEMRLVFE
jgi:outer membrane lipoprotein LolB